MNRICKLLASSTIAAAALAAAPAMATPFIVSLNIGTGSVVGTITTDNTLGVLSTANITAFSLTLNDGAGSLLINNGNAQDVVVGSALTATTTGLFFNFSSATNSALLFQSPTTGSGSKFFCAQTANVNCFDTVAAGMAVDVNSTFPGQVVRLQGNVQIGSAGATGAVPEPATWAMMMVGFGALGGVMRRRRTTQRVRFAI